MTRHDMNCLIKGFGFKDPDFIVLDDKTELPGVAIILFYKTGLRFWWYKKIIKRTLKLLCPAATNIMITKTI